MKAGLPANFFLANPDVLGGATVTSNGGYTRYDSFQLEARKRLSHGFQIDGSYVFGKAYTSSQYSFRLPLYKTLQTGGEGGVTHGFKANWILELPFGEGANGWGAATGSCSVSAAGGSSTASRASRAVAWSTTATSESSG